MSKKIDEFKDLQIMALHAVITQSNEFLVRDMCKTLSREFNMPLDHVENCSLEYIISNYYEWTYSKLERAHLIEEARNLLETDEEKLERLSKEEASLKETQALAEQIRAENEAKEKATAEAMKGVETLRALAEKIKKFKELPEVDLGGSTKAAKPSDPVTLRISENKKFDPF